MLSITVIGLDSNNRWTVKYLGKTYTVPFHALKYGTWQGDNVIWDMGKILNNRPWEIANPDIMKPYTK